MEDSFCFKACHFQIASTKVSFSDYHKVMLNQWLISLRRHVVIYSTMTVCQFLPESFGNYPSTSRYCTGLGKGPDEKKTVDFGSITHMCCWSIDIAMEW